MNALTDKEQKIVAISMSTAKGDMPALQNALAGGLDAGLTVSEIKEILVQLYAYCGFPRSLNALDHFMALLKERAAAGIEDPAGKLPGAMPAGKSIDFGAENQTRLIGAPVRGELFEFAPAIDAFLKAHLFGDIFARDNLDWKTREMVTIAALAAMDGTESQLNGHVAIGKRNGLTDAQTRAIVAMARPIPPCISPFPLGGENTEYAQYFSGRSYLAALAQDKRLGVPIFNVTFEPGCRNNWHVHAGGQILVAVGGAGYYQERGKPARRLAAGAVVEIAPDVEHWHGAAPDSWFSHLAITCNPAANKTTWLEPVSDNDCSGIEHPLPERDARHTPEKPADADNFYKSDRVTAQKVEFKTQYGMAVAGNLFQPQDKRVDAKSPAIIVGHPMGAVKEQSANLYAAKMAERGFVTLAIDLPFWGDSGGQPRNAVLPEMYAEAFSAATDYLRAQPFTDKERLGVIGICGSGSFALSAAKIDPRIKAVATISMYDMGAANRGGLGNAMLPAQRKEIIEAAAKQRDVEFAGGAARYTGGTVITLTENATPVEREFYAFYRTPRGEFTPDGAASHTTTRPTLSSNVKFMNFYPFNDIETISPRALLFVTGDQAHSKAFSEDAYKRAAEPKELYYVPGAGHVDLYDRVHLIPFDKLHDFFSRHLK